MYALTHVSPRHAAVSICRYFRCLSSASFPSPPLMHFGIYPSLRPWDFVRLLPTIEIFHNGTETCFVDTEKSRVWGCILLLCDTNANYERRYAAEPCAPRSQHTRGKNPTFVCGVPQQQHYSITAEGEQESSDAKMSYASDRHARE